jgi:serine/threonine protein kinase
VFAFLSVLDFWTGKGWRGMLMGRLGYHCRHYNRKISVKTVLSCAIQIVSRFECFHQLIFVHRDIKPDKVVFEVGKNSNTLGLVYLGVAGNNKTRRRKIPAYTRRVEGLLAQHMTYQSTYTSRSSGSAATASNPSDMC